MDPVCMLTIYPQLLRNFVYKMPNFMRMNSLLGFVDSLRFVFSRDLMVAEVSRRQPWNPAHWFGTPLKTLQAKGPMSAEHATHSVGTCKAPMFGILEPCMPFPAKPERALKSLT